MYNKENFTVAKIASKDSTRYNLNSIYCHPKFTVGCDGRMLMIITSPKSMSGVIGAPSVDEMPIPTDGELTDKFEPFILNLDDAKKVEKSIPKKSSLPILHHVALLKSDNGNAKFFTTDLQSQNITVSKKIDGEYPQFGKVLPKGRPIKTIRVQTKLLKTLVEAIEAAQGSRAMPYVDLQIYENEEGQIGLKSTNSDTGQRITAVLMAMKK